MDNTVTNHSVNNIDIDELPKSLINKLNEADGVYHHPGLHSANLISFDKCCEQYFNAKYEMANNNFD